MDFVTKGNEYASEQFLSSTGHKYMEFEVPQGKNVKRGDAVNAGAELSDGTDLFGIVMEDADGTTVKTKTTVAISGEFIFEGLKVKAGTQKAGFTKAARDKGSVIKGLGGKE